MPLNTSPAQAKRWGEVLLIRPTCCQGVLLKGCRLLGGGVLPSVTAGLVPIAQCCEGAVLPFFFSLLSASLMEGEG